MNKLITTSEREIRNGISAKVITFKYWKPDYMMTGNGILATFEIYGNARIHSDKIIVWASGKTGAGDANWFGKVRLSINGVKGRWFHMAIPAYNHIYNTYYDEIGETTIQIPVNKGNISFDMEYCYSISSDEGGRRQKVMSRTLKETIEISKA